MYIGVKTLHKLYMQKQLIISLLIGAVIGGGIVAWYQNNSAATTTGTVSYHPADESRMLHNRGGQMGMMQQMFVTSEQAFIEHMIPHHQEAIDTAGEVLERGGTTEEVRELMDNIIAAQTAEIESMKAWYETWYGNVYEDTGDYEPMMRELEDLSGAELDQAFLQDMIRHHMGAIMMARSVQPYIEHDEITELTQTIVTTQSAEIAQMRQMLQNF